MDYRYVRYISHACARQLPQILTTSDIELTTKPFLAMPLSMELIPSDTDACLMGYAWEQMAYSMVFRIQLYPSDLNVIMECRRLRDPEHLFDRWYHWITHQLDEK